jgi:hypothetical protein
VSSRSEMEVANTESLSANSSCSNAAAGPGPLEILVADLPGDRNFRTCAHVSGECNVITSINGPTNHHQLFDCALHFRGC